MLDRDKAMAMWDKNTKRNGSEKLSEEAKERDQRGVPPKAITTTVPDQLKTLIMGLPEDQIPGLDVSRERKEHYNAELARLQALKEREELVPTADVKRMASTLGRQIRDNVMAIPNRVAPLLAAAQDSGEVHRLLSEELRTALRVLADG
jgi:phage terminase Nu1 subunit (DNA packaging protein)